MTVREDFTVEEIETPTGFALTLKDQRSFVRCVATGATRALCIQGLRDMGYTVEEP